MNDRELEDELKKISAPTLPEEWRREILISARRGVDREPQKMFIPLFRLLSTFLRKNPLAMGTLTALWILMFFFKLTQPADSTDQTQLIVLEKAHVPIQLHSVFAEMRLIEALDQNQQQDPKPSIQ